MQQAKPLEISDYDIIIPIALFEATREGIADCWQLSQEISTLRANGFDLNGRRSFVVHGHESDLRFEFFSQDRADDEIVGWWFKPDAESRAVLGGKRVEVLVIND